MSTVQETGAVLDDARLEQLEDFFLNASVGLALGDARDEVSSANRALCLLLGCVSPDACARPIADLFADAGAGAQLVDRVRAGEVVSHTEVELARADGGVQGAIVDASGHFEDGAYTGSRWFVRPKLTAAIPTVDDELQSFDDADPDSDAGRWAASLVDELDARAALDALSVSERRVRLAELEEFFDNAPAAIHFIEASGNVTSANKADLTNVGHLDSPGEYVGHHVRQAYADQALLEDLLGRLGGGTPVINCRAELRRKDGSTHSVIVYSSSRVTAGEFENTRCMVFSNPDQTAEPTQLRRFDWPRDS